MNSEYFEKIYKKYFNVLFYYILKIVSKKEVAEDIVQEVFLRYWEERESIDRSVSPKPYLYTLAYHKSIDYLRRSETFNISLSDFGTNLDKIFFKFFLTDESFDVRDLEKAIDTAIRSLPPKCRQVFLLSREEGLKNSQIADIMNITTKAIEKHISKAIKHIKSALERMGFFKYVFFLFLFLLKQIFIWISV